MRKKEIVLLFTILLALLFIGCDTGLDYEDPWSGYDSYLSNSEYNTLIIRLSNEQNINRDTIDSILEELNVRQNYEYSLYTSGDYLCHSLLWNKYSSYTYDWIYYVDVDIWTDSSGNLRESMCSYYSD